MSLERRHQGPFGWPVRRARGHGRPVRQRPIRSTITILLVIPLLSLIALWAYAATSTVGGALARRTSDQLNTDIGGPLQVLVAQLDAERTDTFTWQSAHSVLRRNAPAAERAAVAAQHTALVAQRVHTNAAVTAFRAGAAAGAGLEPAAAKLLAAAVLAQLSQLAAIRARADAGTIAPLKAFEDYNAMGATFYPFSLSTGSKAPTRIRASTPRRRSSPSPRCRARSSRPALAPGSRWRRRPGRTASEQSSPSSPVRRPLSGSA
jgi:hypothetical protein